MASEPGAAAIGEIQERIDALTDDERLEALYYLAGWTALGVDCAITDKARRRDLELAGQTSADPEASP